ncbi:MAG: DUF6702 family protein [Planctomycetota bacterium]
MALDRFTLYRRMDDRAGRLRHTGIIPIAAIALAALVSSAPAAAACHPFNETRAEVALNPESGDLEVALGFDALALEEVLIRTGSSAETARKATEGENHSATVEKYVRSRFAVEQHGAAQPIRWVGQEVEHSSVWVYFVIELEGPLVGSRWINELLFELADPDPLNLVILRDGETTHRWVHRRSEAEYVWGCRPASGLAIARWIDRGSQLIGRGLERATRRALISNSSTARRHVRDGAVLVAALLGDRERLATVTSVAVTRADVTTDTVPQSDLRTLLGYARWLAAGER